VDSGDLIKIWPALCRKRNRQIMRVDIRWFSL